MKDEVVTKEQADSMGEPYESDDLVYSIDDNDDYVLHIPYRKLEDNRIIYHKRNSSSHLKNQSPDEYYIFNGTKK